ncbi:DUF805 domain-containing protein [Tenacibaculum sp. M341]|uniref:DUF805 domain-containing protein n=1 Tax=Tenacibaculum sp. M341 TaxID=2530339 RepID=UPI0010470B7F|nr:DUF805 domain-containing protein [Tenacibaculum sp. M341]TCI91103.1 DUF805 domain-containing protein [Tenacibaculum sp. M341]
MNWYVKVLKQYVDFNGRARRQEFWMFTLINFLISLAINILSLAIAPELAILGTLYSLAVLLPSLAVGARRLHDIGKSGWLLLLILIPLIGVILLIVWWATDSEHGPNDWGPNPKGIGNVNEIDSLGKE